MVPSRDERRAPVRSADRSGGRSGSLRPSWRGSTSRPRGTAEVAGLLGVSRQPAARGAPWPPVPPPVIEARRWADLASPRRAESFVALLGPPPRAQAQDGGGRVMAGSALSHPPLRSTTRSETSMANEFKISGCQVACFDVRRYADQVTVFRAPEGWTVLIVSRHERYDDEGSCAAPRRGCRSSSSPTSPPSRSSSSAGTAGSSTDPTSGS